MSEWGRRDREQVVTQRATAATTLQAIELTNGATLHEILARGAGNLLLATETRDDDDDEATDEGLDNVPVRSLEVQVGLLSLIEQPESDDLGNQATARRDKHRRGREMNRVLKPHEPHP